MNEERFTQTLRLQEGYRRWAYRDTEGKLTVGIGRNLESTGISEEEASLLLANDIRRVCREAASAFPWFGDLDEARQEVILNMIFNMGVPTLRKFKKMIAAIEKKDYALAAGEMLDSHWRSQVGDRAVKLAAIMRGPETEG